MEKEKKYKVWKKESHWRTFLRGMRNMFHTTYPDGKRFSKERKMVTFLLEVAAAYGFGKFLEACGIPEPIPHISPTQFVVLLALVEIPILNGIDELPQRKRVPLILNEEEFMEWKIAILKKKNKRLKQKFLQDQERKKRLASSQDRLEVLHDDLHYVRKQYSEEQALQRILQNEIRTPKQIHPNDALYEELGREKLETEKKSHHFPTDPHQILSFSEKENPSQRTTSIQSPAKVTVEDSQKRRVRSLTPNKS